MTALPVQSARQPIREWQQRHNVGDAITALDKGWTLQSNGQMRLQ